MPTQTTLLGLLGSLRSFDAAEHARMRQIIVAAPPEKSEEIFTILNDAKNAEQKMLKLIIQHDPQFPAKTEKFLRDSLAEAKKVHESHEQAGLQTLAQKLDA